MNSDAIMMLVIAIVLVWGGLALALINLARHPEAEEDLPEEPIREL